MAEKRLTKSTLLSLIKEQITLFNQWKGYLSDADASLELYSLDPEDDLIKESFYFFSGRIICKWNNRY